MQISGSNSNITVYDNYIAQQTIVDDLKQLLLRGPSANLLTSIVTKQPPDAMMKTSLPSTSSPKPNSGQDTSQVPDTTSKPMTISNTGDKQAGLMANGPYDSSISDTSKPWKGTQLDQNLVREGSNFAGHLTAWNPVWNEFNTTVHPEALVGLELANRRLKRESGGKIYSGISLSTIV